MQQQHSTLHPCLSTQFPLSLVRFEKKTIDKYESTINVSIWRTLQLGPVGTIGKESPSQEPPFD